jgi:hypothetical protein
MTFPTELPFSVNHVYGVGRVVRSEHTVDEKGDGTLFLTYIFPLQGIAPHELGILLDVVRGAIEEYADENGFKAIRSGTMGLTESPSEPDEDLAPDDIEGSDDYRFYDDDDDLDFLWDF